MKKLGLAMIALAVGFNLPFALLGARFDYPDILRHTAAEVLTAFAAGGPGLVLIWFSFAVSAMALIPVAIALAFSQGDWQARPGLAVGAAITGALAGLVQAIGLLRWVFAVPVLAASYTDPAATDAQRAALETGFILLNQWGGVAIGEHLGQALTALWLGLTLAARWNAVSRFDRICNGVAVLAVVGIVLGLGEGLSLALGTPVAMFSLFTILGYLAFSLWLVLTGIAMLRGTTPVGKPALA